VVLGQTIGRYQIRRILGRGGMGRVYLARDIVLGRSVALKIVGGSSYSERFLHEARAIAMLNHPNIVQLYDYGEHDHGIFLALEYVRARPCASGYVGARSASTKHSATPARSQTPCFTRTRPTSFTAISNQQRDGRPRRAGQGGRLRDRPHRR